MISEFVKNPTCIFSSPSYFFWQVERTRLQYTMSCKKHSVLWILWKEVNDMILLENVIGTLIKEILSDD